MHPHGRNSAKVHVSNDEESEAETKEEDGSEDEFVTERKEPVPRWEVLAEHRAVWGLGAVLQEAANKY
jgi:hypothetical protein